MSAGLYVGFPFYQEDPIWEIHKWVYNRLMTRSSCVVGGVEFHLCPDDEDTDTPYWGVFVVGTETNHSSPVRALEIEKARVRVVTALEAEGIYIPCQYGPVIFISNFGGSRGTGEGQEDETAT